MICSKREILGIWIKDIGTDNIFSFMIYIINHIKKGYDYYVLL